MTEMKMTDGLNCRRSNWWTKWQGTKFQDRNMVGPLCSGLWHSSNLLSNWLQRSDAKSTVNKPSYIKSLLLQSWFRVLQFHVLSFGPAFSCPAFSALLFNRLLCRRSKCKLWQVMWQVTACGRWRSVVVFQVRALRLQQQKQMEALNAEQQRERELEQERALTARDVSSRTSSRPS